MAKYTDEEIKGFERKDMLNSRMSAIKAISTVCEGTNISEDELLKRADKIFDWIAQDQTWEIPNTLTAKTLKNSEDGNVTPVPTVKQKEWLDRIQDKHKFTPEQVLKALGKYPGNKEDALKAIKLLKDKNG